MAWSEDFDFNKFLSALELLRLAVSRLIYKKLGIIIMQAQGSLLLRRGPACAISFTPTLIGSEVDTHAIRGRYRKTHDLWSSVVKLDFVALCFKLGPFAELCMMPEETWGLTYL